MATKEKHVNSFAVEDIDCIWKNLWETLNSAVRMYYANVDDQGQLEGFPLAESVAQKKFSSTIAMLCAKLKFTIHLNNNVLSVML